MTSKHVAAITLAILLWLPCTVSAGKTTTIQHHLLSSSQIMRISGEAGLSSGTYYAGNLYNGNNDIVVTEISVYVRTKKGGEVFPRTYLCKVHIPPLSSTPFGFDIALGDADSDYTWGIYEAKGYKTP
jgi:hypothetical protein